MMTIDKLVELESMTLPELAEKLRVTTRERYLVDGSLTQFCNVIVTEDHLLKMEYKAYFSRGKYTVTLTQQAAIDRIREDLKYISKKGN